MPYASYGIHILFDTLGNRNNKKIKSHTQREYGLYIFSTQLFANSFDVTLNTGFVYQFIFHGYHFTVPKE